MPLPEPKDPYKGQRMVEEDALRDAATAQREAMWKARDSIPMFESPRAFEAFLGVPEPEYRPLSPVAKERIRSAMAPYEDKEIAKLRASEQTQLFEQQGFYFQPSGQMVHQAELADPSARPWELIHLKVNWSGDLGLDRIRWRPGAPVIDVDPETQEATEPERQPNVFARTVHGVFG